MLAESASDLFGEGPPASLRRLSTTLARTPERIDTTSYEVRQKTLNRHSANFDSAKAELTQWMLPRQLPPMEAAIELELTLPDSLHTMLRASLRRQKLAAISHTSPELDSLDAALTRLITLRAARAESNATLIDEASGALSPLVGTAERAQIRELAWQLYNAADLLRNTLSIQEASVRFAAIDLDLRTRLLLEDAMSRLSEVAGTLAHATLTLQKALSQIPVPDPDSLHLFAAAIENTLLQQERSLASLQNVLSSLDEEAPLQRPLHLLSDATALYEGVHRDLVSLDEALSAQLNTDLQNYGLKIFLTVLFVLVGLAVVRVAIWLLNTASERSASRRLFYKRLIPIARLIVLSVTTYIVLAYVFKLDQRSLLAAGAAIGVAIGFAAQDILKNIFGGMIIIFDQPFQVGDKIRVGDTYGEVVSIGLRATRIVTPDDNLVTVPNAHVINSQIANANTGALHCQVVVELYVPGWSDATKAKAIAYGAAANSKYVFLGKPIVVNIRDEFKMTFLTRLAVKAYVLDTRYEFAFASDVTESAKAEFRKQGYYDQLIDNGVSTTAP